MLKQCWEIADRHVVAWMKPVIGRLLDVADSVAFKRAARRAKSSDDLELPEPIAEVLSNAFSLFCDGGGGFSAVGINE